MSTRETRTYPNGQPLVMSTNRNTEISQWTTTRNFSQIETRKSPNDQPLVISTNRFPSLYLAEITSGCPLGDFVSLLDEFSVSLLVDITTGWPLGNFRVSVGWVFRVSICWVFRVSIGWNYEWFSIGIFPCLCWLTLRGLLLGDFRASIVWVFLVSIGWHYEWLIIGSFPCLNWLSFPSLYWMVNQS
jgi:hypothetical protein